MSRPGWNGRTIRAALAHVTTRDGRACAICDHPGGTLSLDHAQPVTLRPDLEWEPTNWKATHLNPAGTTHGCTTPGCTCPGNTGRQAVSLDVIRAIVKQANTPPTPTREW